MTAVDDGDGETPPPGTQAESIQSDGPETGDRRGVSDVDASDVAQLRADFEAFREEVEERTLPREEVESDLRKYVRKRMRRGHARGWGPYLVLLYGTAMTLGAFYFLGGGWAILAMVVVWLSTLGLYALMLIVGIGIEVVGLPGKVIDRVR
ncbi:ribonuclease BN [Halomicrobium salinisoli]|uniref:ribonuclease BN n=1 Tax=Halomicrobium salinisoli TaxID=2878391 RepID=UPI003B837833